MKPLDPNPERAHTAEAGVGRAAGGQDLLQALQESEARYRLISELVSDYAFAFSIDDNGLPRVDWVTGAISRITGYTKEELDKIGYGAIIHPDDRDEQHARFRKLLAGDQDSTEFRIITKDGRVRWLRDTSFPVWDDEKQRVIRVIGATSDVTEQRVIQLELTRFFELSPSLFCVADLEGRFHRVNSAFANALGYTPEEMVGRHFSEFTLREDVQRSRAVADKVHAGEHLTNFENRYRCRDGSIRTLSWSAVGHTGEGFVYSVVQDVTEQRRIEEERRQFEQRLQHLQKMESLALLAGGVAHDFNNLLVAILGSTQMAMMDLPKSSPAHESLTQAVDAIRQASQLTQQLLAYSGRATLKLERLDLSELFREMQSLLKVSIERNAKLFWHPEKDLPPINADGTQLRQILMNLVINASDALGGRDGNITVTTGMAERDRAFLAGCALRDHVVPGPMVYLRVEDTGTGMSKETLERVFDPFFTTKGHGRGLGLAALQGIVRSHRGYVYVESAPKDGTVFEIGFPAAHGSAPEVASTRDTPQGHWEPSGRLLLVDDDDMPRNTTLAMLRRMGFLVADFSSGREALQVFKADPDSFNALVADLTMPHMSGIELFTKVREVAPQIPVLFISGYRGEGTVPEVATEPRTAFLAKPYRYGDLLEKLRSLMDRYAGG